MPVLHLQSIVKSLQQQLSVTADLIWSKQPGTEGQRNADLMQHGRTATVLSIKVLHSLAYHLAITEEFEESHEAASAALEDGCSALVLSIKHWASLTRRVASEGMQSSSAAGPKPASNGDDAEPRQEPQAGSDKASDHTGDVLQGADLLLEAATAAEVADPTRVQAPSVLSSDRSNAQQDKQVQINKYEEAWAALLRSVLTVASRNRSFKKDCCDEIAKQIATIADALPVNEMGLACLQLASSACMALGKQVYKPFCSSDP